MSARLNVGRLNAFRLTAPHYTIAALNVGRLGAFRLNADNRARYRWSVLHDLSTGSATLDGSPLRVRAGSLTVHDALNDTPNTCTFVVDAATPPRVGGRVRVSTGARPSVVVFVGTIQSAEETYVGRPTPTVRAWSCEAIDDTSVADWWRPFGQWDNVSATAVVQQIVASFTPGPLAAIVQPNLPPITIALDGTSRVNEALRQIVKLIGGFFYWDDGALHLFVTPEAGATPDPIDGAPGRFLLADPPLSWTTDDSQIRTRVYGRGHAEDTLTAIDAGETRVPIANAVMFNTAGGKAIVDAQRIAYAGTVIGGGGALVGPGITPSTPPIAAAVTGSGVTPGAHSWAYTWATASGETLPSPVASLTVSAGSPSASIESVSSGVQAGGPPAGTALQYVLVINDGSAFGTYSPIVAAVSNGTRPVVAFRTSVDMRGLYVTVFRQDNHNGQWFGIGAQGQDVPGMTAPFPLTLGAGQLVQWTDMTTSGGGGALPPGGTLTAQRVTLSGIATGPAGTANRRIFRTAAGGSTLQLVDTLIGNTATTYTDATPDGSLGAAASSGDTSGLQTVAGLVKVGATSFPVSSAAWALPGGGWAVIGNGAQVIKYTGVTGNTLTGIPASGTGALTAPVNYNSTITGAPMLVGVSWGAQAWPVRQGAPVAIWIQRDDLAAQAALAARARTGVIEQVIVDGRRGEPSLTALCDADLAMYSRPLVTVRYTTLDPQSKSGRPVRVVLPALNIDTTLTIQDVTIDHFGQGPIRFQVVASNQRTITLEDMMRRITGKVWIDEGY